MGHAPAAHRLPTMLPGTFPSFDTPAPPSADAWEAAKPELRRTLWTLLGDLPPAFTPQATLLSRQQREGFTLEHFTFDNQAGATVYGYLLIPDGHRPGGPAVLYHHYHGDRYHQGKEELLLPAFAEFGGAMVTGPDLVQMGYVVLAIDAYGFGQRQYHGPAGEYDQGNATEQSLFKMFLWQGRSLWGMMVRDDLLALNYLASRPEVDPNRIAAMGMSMGSTRSWWLAALDERIRVVVSASCLTRYQDLIAAGGLRYHGIYYFVPGMLQRKIDTESVVGLIAPRPHLTLTGAADDGSPVAGVRTINHFQQQLYSLYGRPQDYRGLIYEGAGHIYSPEMWREALAWLKEHL